MSFSLWFGCCVLYMVAGKIQHFVTQKRNPHATEFPLFLYIARTNSSSWTNPSRKANTAIPQRDWGGSSPREMFPTQLAPQSQYN